MKQCLIIIILFLYNFVLVVLFWTRKVLMRSWIDNWNWVNLKFTYNCCVRENVVIYQYYISNDNLTQLNFVCNTMQLHLCFTA